MYPNKNLLSAEEMEYLKDSNVKAVGAISKRDMLRAYCTHVDNTGKSVVQELKDGSGNVWCPICDAEWDPRELDKEEVTKLVSKVIDCIQNIKLMNSLPEEVGRDYYSVIALLEKLPGIYEYANELFTREPVNDNTWTWGQEPFRIPHLNGMCHNVYGMNMYSPGIIPQPYQKKEKANIPEKDDGISNKDFPWMNVE